MQNENIINKSIGWSFFSEITAKFITPITSMLLARLLSPSDFGIVAVCNMIISFSDIIKDAGFSKFLIQKDFSNNDEFTKYCNVAFWSNFILSFVIYLIILFFCDEIGSLLGAEEYSLAISISCVQLLITSFTSIQTNLLRRSFEYKELFSSRIFVAALPLIITVPLAYYFRSYWSIIVGNLIGSLLNSIFLLKISGWYPKIYYSLNIFRKMLFFSFWSLCEGMAHWAIFWGDIFIIANIYSEYYVGLYKNSSNMVMSLMGMVSAAISPVLLSVLSRIKHDKGAFFTVFLNIHRLLMYIVIPMGIGIYSYRTVLVQILLGEKWIDSADIIGYWGLMMMCSIIFYSFSAELYKSKGIPQVLFLFQLSYLFFLVPVCIWSAKNGFWSFVFYRCTAVVELIIVSLLFMRIVFGFECIKIIKNTINPILTSSIILIIHVVFSEIFGDSIIFSLFGVFFSIIFYFTAVRVFFWKDVLNIIKNLKEKELS